MSGSGVRRAKAAHSKHSGRVGRRSRYTGPWSVTGARCCAAAAGPADALPGACSTRSKNGHRCCNLNCASLTGSCKRLQCCEPTAEERGAVKPHATFCGNRGRATASGDPVGGEKSSSLPRPVPRGSHPS